MNAYLVGRQINQSFWEVVVAQLVERSLPTPETRSSNTVFFNSCIKNVLK